MIKTIKVQQTKTNTTISIPKEIKNIFSVAKGDILLIETISDKELKITRVD